jgi:trigger factor
MVKQMGARSRPEAIDRLKQSLALEEIAKRESLQAEPEAITARVNELLEQFPDDQNIDRNGCIPLSQPICSKKKQLAG